MYLRFRIIFWFLRNRCNIRLLHTKLPISEYENLKDFQDKSQEKWENLKNIQQL